MAQLVEQRIRNAQAVGSSPTTSSRKTRKASRLAGFLPFRSLSAGLDLSFISAEAHAAQPCATNRDTNPLLYTVIAPDGNPPSGAFFGGFFGGTPARAGGRDDFPVPENVEKGVDKRRKWYYYNNTT